MQWLWAKKRIQWIPRPGLLPDPRLIARNPELAEIEHNPHFRMLCARAPLDIHWGARIPLAALAAVVAFPWILRPVWPWGPEESEIVFGLIGWGACLVFMANIETTTSGWGWNQGYFLPTEKRILTDYLASGITPEMIVTGMAALDLRAEKIRALRSVAVIGLTGSALSAAVSPTPLILWTRAAIIVLVAAQLGSWVRPEGIAMRRVLAAAKNHRILMNRRRHPFRETLKTLLVLVPLAVGLIVLVVALMVVVGLVVHTSHRWSIPDFSTPFFVVSFVAAALAAAGVSLLRAHRLLRREPQNRLRACGIIAELLEWHRETLFENEVR